MIEFLSQYSLEVTLGAIYYLVSVPGFVVYIKKTTGNVTVIEFILSLFAGWGALPIIGLIFAIGWVWTRPIWSKRII